MKTLDPVNADENRKQLSDEQAQRKYKELPHPEMHNLIECLDKPAEYYAEAISAESMSNDYLGDCLMELHALGLSDADYGRIVKERVLTYLAELASDKMAARGEFQSDPDDILATIL